jgi:hypothetical protein
LTLPSYGKVHHGAPIDPATYDYRAAALDALLFPRLVDRWWQNLRRCAGYQVQYFAAVEPQRRLAPHLHAAIRGSIPRATLRAVAAATYRAIWWPPLDPVHYDDMPTWAPQLQRLVDHSSGVVLATWDEALDAAERVDAFPTHVLRLGSQLDIQGVLVGSRKADRAVGYLCKYLTKDIATAHDDPDNGPSAAYAAHVDRLHREVQALPCSEECPNWVLYGTAPRGCDSHTTPGRCTSKAHDREALGLGGRRVLVSRHWTGKTLTEHRADRAAVVRAVLEEAGYAPPDAKRMAATVLHTDGQPRYVWDELPATDDDRDYTAAIAASLRQRQAWREQYEAAKQTTGRQRAGPPGDNHSAIRAA